LSAQEIVNWVTTADGCVHTADATRLDSFVSSASAVCIGHKTHLIATIYKEENGEKSCDSNDGAGSSSVGDDIGNLSGVTCEVLLT